VEIHLHCPRCGCHFQAPGTMPAAEVLGRMTDDAPWFALAEGDTFADMVFAALASRGKILCPECRGEILVGARPDAGDSEPRRQPSPPPVPGAPGPESG
jgi:hypothetical protein